MFFFIYMDFALYIDLAYLAQVLIKVYRNNTFNV